MATARGLEDASNGMAFRIVKQATGGLRARLGRLEVPHRMTMVTPHHLGVTSRGVIPHLSQDTLMQKTEVNGVYVALEDCKPTYQRAINAARLTARLTEAIKS